jgi:D-alanyl-D-alanine carboxypeptidase (penicillin-binding protein 5/6)
VVAEAETGRILYERNPTLLRAPASLVKMMTALLLLEALDQGKVALTDTFSVSWEATRVGGAKVGLRSREKIRVEDAAKAMVIASGNDAAIALASYLAGSVPVFVMRMNQRAIELGMYHTHYDNPHGLDSWEGGSLTTARDQVILARQLIRHPLFLKWSSSRWAFIRKGQGIRNTNWLLGRFEGLDGLKTGYTGPAGYCLASTAERNGLRLVCVLLGAPSSGRRFSETAGLLTQVFARYQSVEVIQQGQGVGRLVSIHGGRPSHVRLLAGEDVRLILPNDDRRPIRLDLDAPRAIDPPVSKGLRLGQLEVRVGDSLATSVPVVSAGTARRAGLLERLAYKVGLLR